MRKLLKIQNEYEQKLIDLKYEKAISLLSLVSDEDYLKICELNKELISPIQTERGDEYLHDPKVLDLLIAIFTDYIEKAPLNVDEMDSLELKSYIISLIQPLDDERLKGIIKTLHALLGN